MMEGPSSLRPDPLTLDLMILSIHGKSPMSKASIILPDYHRIRPISNELGTLASAKITKPAVVSESKLVGLWEDGGLALGSEEELNVILDHIVHDGRGGLTTPMERITKKQLEPLGPDAPRIHAAMAKARLNLYILNKCRPGLGWEVEDIWQEQKFLVVDEALSEMPEAKGFMAVMRLVSMGEWCFNTGVQGSTFGPERLKTLYALLLATPLAEIKPPGFHPPSFARQQNLLWSRSLLRAWLRPGSVELVTIPIEIGTKKLVKPKRRT